jgi:hypothetical protein
VKFVPLVEPAPRPNVIRRNPCSKCPSAHYPPDPVTLAMMDAPRQEQLEEGIFTCAWTPGKLCRGICDRLNVTEADLAEGVAP